MAKKEKHLFQQEIAVLKSQVETKENEIDSLKKVITDYEVLIDRLASFIPEKGM